MLRLLFHNRGLLLFYTQRKCIAQHKSVLLNKNNYRNKVIIIPERMEKKEESRIYLYHLFGCTKIVANG